MPAPDLWGYDPGLGRFVQPDMVIPGISNPQSYNRYSYVLNDPIFINDPSRFRCPGGGNQDSDGYCYNYQINIGKGFTVDRQRRILKAVKDVGLALWRASGYKYDTAQEAWLAVFGAGFTFSRVGGDNCMSKGKSAYACTSHNLINVANFYNDDRDSLLMVHEIGHALDLSACKGNKDCWFGNKGTISHDTLEGKLHTCSVTTINGSDCLGRFSNGPSTGVDK
jgi:hypothetical protein